MPNPLVIAKNATAELALLPSLANRHGCITGATGTGKTISLQVLAEHFSRIGVPVFLADVKGDLGGIAQSGAMSPKLQERLTKLGLLSQPSTASPSRSARSRSVCARSPRVPRRSASAPGARSR